MNKNQDPAFFALCKQTSQEPLTTGEQLLLNQWMEENGELLDREIMSEYPSLLEIAAIEAAAPTWDEFLAMNSQRLRDKKRASKIRSIKRWALAAAAIFIIGIALYLLLQKLPGNSQPMVVGHRKSGMPGGFKATLGLANEQFIDLENASTGHLANQGNTSIIKRSSGYIKYDTGKTGLGKPYSNTLTTPAGGEYHIKLADGTGVTLNAASQLSYPSVFNDSIRTVWLSGEAYFEVAKDPNRPFIVITRIAGKNANTRDVGTKFNVNAYDNEPAHKITLKEGSVKITLDSGVAILSPGQEAVVDAQKNIKVLTDPQSAQSLAWTEEFFDFQNADFTTVMHQLERWYNVSFRDKAHRPFIQPKEFTRVHLLTKRSRALPITRILNDLATHENFTYTIEGNEVLISPIISPH